MPSVSRQQRKAMLAAKAGKSTLGIPTKVGSDFIKADKGKDLSRLPLRKGAPTPAKPAKK